MITAGELVRMIAITATSSGGFKGAPSGALYSS
jgi:hypothetical protein